MMVACGNIKNIKVTAVASDFDFLGASMASAEGEAFIRNSTRYRKPNSIYLCKCWGRNEDDGKFNIIISNDKNHIGY